MEEQKDKNEDKSKAEPDEIAKLKKERDEYLDGWKRAKADFINYKKEERERAESLMRYGNAVLLGELISVLDSFDLGLSTIKDEAAKKGVQLIKIQFEDLLKKYGLEKIKVNSGDDFDPARDEAVEEIESELPAGKIVEEVGTGYLLSGKVLRPVRVKISKGQK